MKIYKLTSGKLSRLLEGEFLENAIARSGITGKKIQIVMDMIKEGRITVQIFVPQEEMDEVTQENQRLSNKIDQLRLSLDSERDMNDMMKRDLNARVKIIETYITDKRRDPK